MQFYYDLQLSSAITHPFRSLATKAKAEKEKKMTLFIYYQNQTNRSSKSF